MGKFTMGFMLSYKLDVLIKKIILWMVVPFKEQQVIISSMNCNGTRTVSISNNNELILTHQYEWTLNVKNDITGEENHYKINQQQVYDLLELFGMSYVNTDRIFPKTFIYQHELELWLGKKGSLQNIHLIPN